MIELSTDTDSLTYEIKAEDVYQDFWHDKGKFDDRDYPENSPYLMKKVERLLRVLKRMLSKIISNMKTIKTCY